MRVRLELPWLLIDSDVVDLEWLWPGVEPLVTRLPEFPPLGAGIVSPGGWRLTPLIERPTSCTAQSTLTSPHSSSHLTGQTGWSRTPGRREREAPRVCRCCLQSTRRSPTVPRQGLALSVCISRSRLVLQRANEIVFSFHQWKLPIMKARCFFVHSIS